MASAWHTSHADADPIVATPLADRAAPPSRRRAGPALCGRRRRLLEPGLDAGSHPGRAARTGGRPGRDDPDRLGFDRRGRDADQASPGRDDLDLGRSGGGPGGHPGLRARRRRATPSISARRSPGDRSRPRSRPARPRPGPDYFATWDPEGGRFATLARRPAVRRRDPRSCSSTHPPRPPSRSRSIDRSSPRRRSGSTPIASWSSPAMPAAPTSAIVDTTTGEISDGPAGARLLATSVDWAPGRHDGGPGCADRDPRHGRLAGRRRVIARLDRAAGRLHDRDRLRARFERPAARGRLGRPGRLGQPRRSTTAAQTGAASPNRRSAPPRGAVVAWLPLAASDVSNGQDRRRAPDGAGEGGVRAPERAHLKVRERGAEAPTRARAVPRRA